MAGRDSGSTEGTGKVGRLKIEGKQRKLMVKDSKKVKFNIPEDKRENDDSKEMKQILEKIRKEMEMIREERRYREDSEELKRMEREREDRISKLKGKVEGLEKMLKRSIEVRGNRADRRQIGD